MSAESVESLHHAIKRGDTLHVAHYIESGGDANRPGKFGTTLLMFAAQEGQTPIIDLLLRAGADINGTSEHSIRRFHWPRWLVTRALSNIYSTEVLLCRTTRLGCRSLDFFAITAQSVSGSLIFYRRERLLRITHEV